MEVDHHLHPGRTLKQRFVSKLIFELYFVANALNQMSVVEYFGPFDSTSTRIQTWNLVVCFFIIYNAVCATLLTLACFCPFHSPHHYTPLTCTHTTSYNFKLTSTSFFLFLSLTSLLLFPLFPLLSLLPLAFSPGYDPYSCWFQRPMA